MPDITCKFTTGCLGVAMALAVLACSSEARDHPSAQRGLALLTATRDSLPGYVGANLRCVSCHLDNGRRPNAIPLTGVYARFPKYADRPHHVMSIQERVNDCFRRSLAGRAIPTDGRDMRDVVEYLRVLSVGVAPDGQIPGQGIASIPEAVPDVARGAQTYLARCSRCHATDGRGIAPAAALWGARSFTIAASMARLERAASFIKHNMPLDSAGVLSNQEAYDVAAYIDSHPRPDFVGKENDWPNGNAPGDVPYVTRGHAAYNPPPLLPAFR